MAKPIDFYFDFSSPYAYLASKRIEALAKKFDRDVNWHPILLGIIFKTTGNMPLTMQPLKGDYAIRDFIRTAREQGISYEQPSTFPIASQAPCRVFYWLNEHGDEAHRALATPFLHAAFNAYFDNDRNISDPSTTVEIAVETGVDQTAVETALDNPAVKDRLKEAVAAAIERGVFGAPLMFVDDEPFWGHDRLEQMERWLQSGGW